jgi:Polyketide cyclase / dehydrase and lipid transport
MPAITGCLSFVQRSHRLSSELSGRDYHLRARVGREAVLIRVEVSTTIDRPVEQVFRFVEDEANIPKWDSDLLKATKTSDGPIGAGTTFHLDIKPFMGATEGDGRV